MPTGKKVTEYRKTMPHEVEMLLGQGFTVPQICKTWQISTKTFYKWLKEHKELKAACEKGRDFWSTETGEKNLLKLAEGYDYYERVYEIPRNGKGKKQPDGKDPKPVLVKKTKKHMAPSLGAIMAILVNRMPKRWQHASKLQVSGNPNGEPIPIKLQGEMSLKDLRNAIKRDKKKKR
jgi:transposase